MLQKQHVWLIIFISGTVWMLTCANKNHRKHTCSNYFPFNWPASNPLHSSSNINPQSQSPSEVADLDYYDFVAQVTREPPPVLPVTTPAPEILSSSPPAVSDILSEIFEDHTIKEKFERATDKGSKKEKDGHSKHEDVKQNPEVVSIAWFDLSAHLAVLFPDPFQAYVFSGLLLWLTIALILLRREWKKSSRIVLDVFLQQGPEAIQLVEDRYKDQLNLPGEYSILS